MFYDVRVEHIKVPRDNIEVGGLDVIFPAIGFGNNGGVFNYQHTTNTLGCSVRFSIPEDQSCAGCGIAGCQVYFCKRGGTRRFGFPCNAGNQAG